MKYHNEAQALGVDVNELYEALVSDGQVNPPEWNTQGTYTRSRVSYMDLERFCLRATG